MAFVLIDQTVSTTDLKMSMHWCTIKNLLCVISTMQLHPEGIWEVWGNLVGKRHKYTYSFYEFHPVDESHLFQFLRSYKNQWSTFFYSWPFCLSAMLSHVKNIFLSPPRPFIQCSPNFKIDHLQSMLTKDVANLFHITHRQIWHERHIVFYAISCQHCCLLHWNLICKMTMLWWLLSSLLYLCSMLGRVIAACSYICNFVCCWSHCHKHSSISAPVLSM